MRCHFVNGPSHVVASSLHDITLVGCHSYFLFLGHSFCWLFVLFGLAAERQGFSGFGRQHWHIHCPLGHIHFRSTVNVSNSLNCFFPHINIGCLLCSSTVAFVGTQVAIRDLIGLQLTAKLCQPLARCSSWGFRRQSSSIQWLVN